MEMPPEANEAHRCVVEFENLGILITALVISSLDLRNIRLLGAFLESTSRKRGNMQGARICFWVYTPCMLRGSGVKKNQCRHMSQEDRTFLICLDHRTASHCGPCHLPSGLGVDKVKAAKTFMFTTCKKMESHWRKSEADRKKQKQPGEGEALIEGHEDSWFLRGCKEDDVRRAQLNCLFPFVLPSPTPARQQLADALYKWRTQQKLPKP